MPAASILIKPASSNCNINCQYCFYKCLSSNRSEYSKGFMTDGTLEQLVINAINYADNFLSFAFQGGEPCLAGIDFFKKAAGFQKKYNTKGLVIENTIQTNGMLIDEEWAAFLAENKFLVGISLDGPKKIHDKYRKTIEGGSTFERVMHTINLLEQYHVDYNILGVITNNTAGKARHLYKFYKNNGFRFIQLIPCMDEAVRHDMPDRMPDTTPDKTQDKVPDNITESFAVSPLHYGKFLCEFFDLWYEDFQNGAYMDIRMFSNLAQMAAGFMAEQCGMNGYCQCYFAVEGDGSVYPCDFYCTDEWRLGHVSDGFSHLITSEKALSFVESSKYDTIECKECEYFKLCRGGCRRWRGPFIEGKPGVNYLCQAYKLFFGHTEERIYKLGGIIKARYQYNIW